MFVSYINKLIAINNKLKNRFINLLAKITKKRCQGYFVIKQNIQGKVGLEIGGSTVLFSPNQLIPIYDIVKRIDNCDFANETTWSFISNEINPLKNKLKTQFEKHFISEATNLHMISNETYDFVLASHVLEHLANPIKAIIEWKRVLRDNGSLLIIVPNKFATFDHKRPITSFSHLIEDYNNDIDEDDLTHLEEILTLHDIEMDTGVNSWNEFYHRSLNNQENRCLHHHVLSSELLNKIVDFVGLEVIQASIENNYHIIMLAQKIASE